jgi:hypothetical protein
MNSQPSSACRIGFLNRWSPESHLWGVRLDGGTLQIDRKAFSCCGGDGLLVESTSERIASFCGLTRRWNLLDFVVRQASLSPEKVQDFWRVVLLQGDRMEKSVCDHEMRSLVGEHLDQWLSADKGKPFSWLSPGLGASGIKPHLMSITAAVLSWHYEKAVLMAKPGVAPLPVNLWQDMLKRHPQSKAMMLIELPSDLWNASKLEPLEAAIAFAYERCLPTWLYINQPEESPSPTSDSQGDVRKSRGFRQAVASRLDLIKHKSPLEWLSAQARSRLTEICQLPTAPKDAPGIPEFI